MTSLARDPALQIGHAISLALPQLARGVHEALQDGRLDAHERQILRGHTGPIRARLDSIDRALAGELDGATTNLREAS